MPARVRVRVRVRGMVRVRVRVRVRIRVPVTPRVRGRARVRSRRTILRIFARIGLTPSASAPSSVAIRSSRLAPKTTPVLPYSLVPQHHGMSCVPG